MWPSQIRVQKESKWPVIVVAVLDVAVVVFAVVAAVVVPVLVVGVVVAVLSHCFRRASGLFLGANDLS